MLIAIQALLLFGGSLLIVVGYIWLTIVKFARVAGSSASTKRPHIVCLTGIACLVLGGAIVALTAPAQEKPATTTNTVK